MKLILENRIIIYPTKNVDKINYFYFVSKSLTTKFTHTVSKKSEKLFDAQPTYKM